MASKSNSILEVKNLQKHFYLGKNQVLRAVDNVSFGIREGETLGLVGESGCGKTTTGRMIVRLYEATDGEILYEGERIDRLNRKQAKDYAKKVQMIFQDPYASLNSKMTVGDIIIEGMDIHRMYTPRERQEKVYELLNIVGLSKEHANRFPHEFSGGQRQRIGIARALAIEPKFIVCDEPISALDVSIQAQVVNLLTSLQRELGLTYLFIAHDLSMVKHISDHVAVMYLGVIVEMAKSEELYARTLHPYTKALLSAIPISDPKLERSRQRILLEGDVPSPINPPGGCRFKQRCSFRKPICDEQQPELKEVENGHFVACHLY